MTELKTQSKYEELTTHAKQLRDTAKALYECSSRPMLMEFQIAWLNAAAQLEIAAAQNEQVATKYVG
jgi:hypothetical protein